MNKNSFLFLILILFPAIIKAQSTDIIGELKPGNILIGRGEKILTVTLDNVKIPVENGRLFLLGFDRDAKEKYDLKIVYQNGFVETKTLTLEKRSYDVQKIKVAQKYVEPPKEVLEKIERESEMMKTARAQVGKIDTALYSSGFIRPVKGGRVSGVFGSQRIINGTPRNIHNGVDFTSPIGAPVYATSDGVVIIAGEDFYYNGNFILLDHGHGLSSIYIHLSKLNVKAGDRVAKGDKIGEVGSTGRSTGPHLHWGVQLYNKRIDPLSLLQIKF